MSFSKDIKREVLDNGFVNKDRCLAFLCGLIYSSAEYEVECGAIKNFYITTDIDFLLNSLKVATKMLYNRDDLSIEEFYKINKAQYYKINISDDLALKILLDTKALYLNGKNLELNSGVDPLMLNTEEKLKGFLSGAYIGCGTSSIKIEQNKRTTTGYHMELDNQNYVLLNEVANVLAQFDIFAKLTKRKSLYVLYLKDAEAVSNMLAMMGASDAVLKLQNEIITRQMRNKINRQNNCYTSNYTKTLNASFKQLEAIKILENKIGLDSLPEDLQQVALLRLANTEESLDELLKLSKYPMTKSALNYKYNKLIKLSEKLKGN